MSLYIKIVTPSGYLWSCWSAKPSCPPMLHSEIRMIKQTKWCPIYWPHLQRTCGSGGQAGRDSAVRTAWASGTDPHNLLLTLQTDDLVLGVFTDLAAAHVLSRDLDCHTCAHPTDKSHVRPCVVLQHPPHRRLSHFLLRMASSYKGNAFSRTH